MYIAHKFRTNYIIPLIMKKNFKMYIGLNLLDLRKFIKKIFELQRICIFFSNFHIY
jgi:hypothetical protein